MCDGNGFALFLGVIVGFLICLFACEFQSDSLPNNVLNEVCQKLTGNNNSVYVEEDFLNSFQFICQNKSIIVENKESHIIYR